MESLGHAKNLPASSGREHCFEEGKSRDGKSGLEELWRQKELNDGVRGYQDATENLLEEKGNYYPAELRVYKELNNEPEHM